MTARRVFAEAVLMAGLIMELLLVGAGVSRAQTPSLRVRFLGPDSGSLGGKTLQVCSDHGGQTRIGLLVNRHAAIFEKGSWSARSVGIGWDPVWRSNGISGFWFSPWEDSIAFMAQNSWNSNNNMNAQSMTRVGPGSGTFGASWILPCADTLPALLFVTGQPSRVYAEYGGVLFRSDDSGRTWPKANNNYLQGFRHADLASADIVSQRLVRTGWCEAPIGLCIETSMDLGKTWQGIFMFGPDIHGLDWEKTRFYPSADVLYLRTGLFSEEGSFGTALRASIDGGYTWTLRGLFPFETGFAVDERDPGSVYAVYRDTLCWTFDGGRHWARSGLDLPGRRLTMLGVDPNADILYAAGDGYGVYSIEGISTEIERVSASLKSFNIGPLYPNPAHEDIFIPLTLDRETPVLVTIHDALGRRVATLHDGHLSAGSHTLRQGITGLAKGMYAVRMSCAGSVRTRQFAID
ncbi:MAG: T9SS type A sorting domain-containing protein [Ignavibacteria bacterium]|nr:T9SS type A sorting domain-containing protein [Ignavibacteria bacterium]